MENDKIKSERINTRVYKILIRILNKQVSIDIPGNWRISKIRKFLENQFQDQVKNSTITFVYSGKTIVNDDFIGDIIQV